MHKKQLTKIKDFFSHEMVRNRTEKSLNQQEMADILECSKRTLQRLENPHDLDCTFSSAIQNFSKWASVSNYSLKDWFIKVCCPDEDVSFRAAFKWEKDLITAISKIDPQIRRFFTKQFDNDAKSPAKESEFIEKLNLVVLIANFLLTMKCDQLTALLLGIHFNSEENVQEAFKGAVKKYLAKASDML